jgi:hypothetical protein
METERGAMVGIRATITLVAALGMGLAAGCAMAELPGYTSLLADEATPTVRFAETTATMEPATAAERKPTTIVTVPQTSSGGSAAKPTSASSGSPATGGDEVYPFGRCTAWASPATPSVGGSVTVSVKVLDPNGTPLPGVGVVFLSSYMPFPTEGGFPDRLPDGYAAATSNGSGVASVTVKATPYTCKTMVQVRVDAKTGHGLARISYTAQ